MFEILYFYYVRNESSEVSSPVGSFNIATSLWVQCTKGTKRTWVRSDGRHKRSQCYHILHFFLSSQSDPWKDVESHSFSPLIQEQRVLTHISWEKGNSPVDQLASTGRQLQANKNYLKNTVVQCFYHWKIFITGKKDLFYEKSSNYN